MRIAICGGTFDPFHRGHVEPLLAVRDEMRWDRIIYVPAWQQPFKADRDSTSGYHRFAMIALGIRDHDCLFVSAMELQRGGTSYSIDTLEELHRRHPHAEFDWIIGNDNIASFDKWKDPQRLLELARFVVLNRLSVAQPPPPALDQTRFVFAANAAVAISSTEIRNKVRAGEPIDGMVDPLVSRYIHHNGLYKEGHS